MCIRDSDNDVLMSEEPGKRHLRRRHRMALGEACEFCLPQKSALLDGRIGHDGNAPLTQPRQQIPFDAATREVVAVSYTHLDVYKRQP